MKSLRLSPKTAISHGDEFVVSSNKKTAVDSPFIARYTFDNFVVGESNKLAFMQQNQSLKSRVQATAI